MSGDADIGTRRQGAPATEAPDKGAWATHSPAGAAAARRLRPARRPVPRAAAERQGHLARPFRPDRQAGAGIRPAAGAGTRRPRRPGPRRDTRRPARQGERRQRLRLVVRALPPGAPAAGGSRPLRQGPDGRHQLQGQGGERPALFSARSAIPTTSSAPTTGAAPPSTGASTACRRPSSSMRAAPSATSSSARCRRRPIATPSCRSWTGSWRRRKAEPPAGDIPIA